MQTDKLTQKDDNDLILSMEIGFAKHSQNNIRIYSRKSKGTKYNYVIFAYILEYLILIGKKNRATYFSV